MALAWMFFARDWRSESRFEAAECRAAVNAVRASAVRWAGETCSAWGAWECGCEVVEVELGIGWEGCAAVVVVVVVAAPAGGAGDAADMVSGC